MEKGCDWRSLEWREGVGRVKVVEEGYRGWKRSIGWWRTWCTWTDGGKYATGKYRRFRRWNMGVGGGERDGG